MEFKTEEDVNLAISYFGTLREFISDLLTLPNYDSIKDLLDNYRIQFMDDVDEVPRVGIENPRWRAEKEARENG